MKEDWAKGVEDLEEAHRLHPSPQVKLMKMWMTLLTKPSQTFAQLEEARRKKSLASRRKQSHYQVRLGSERMLS